MHVVEPIGVVGDDIATGPFHERQRAIGASFYEDRAGCGPARWATRSPSTGRCGEGAPRRPRRIAAAGDIASPNRPCRRKRTAAPWFAASIPRLSDPLAVSHRRKPDRRLRPYGAMGGRMTSRTSIRRLHGVLIAPVYFRVHKAGTSDFEALLNLKQCSSVRDGALAISLWCENGTSVRRRYGVRSPASHRSDLSSSKS
jgi:hypothetical protein